MRKASHSRTGLSREKLALRTSARVKTMLRRERVVGNTSSAPRTHNTSRGSLTLCLDKHDSLGWPDDRDAFEVPERKKVVVTRHDQAEDRYQVLNLNPFSTKTQARVPLPSWIQAGNTSSRQELGCGHSPRSSCRVASKVGAFGHDTSTQRHHF